MDTNGIELHPLVNGKDSFDDSGSDDTSRQSIELNSHAETPLPRSERGAKLFVLALTCTFGIGSHYSLYCIGPLRDILERELSIGDSQMSLVLGSNLVANTIVPIGAGVLVARFGTLKSSLFATGVIFLGQAINLVSVIRGNVSGMIFGLCLFGTGLSPLALIQEVMVVQVFEGENMGLAIALGLVAGKATSFIASFTTVPLALHTSLSYRSPFIVSTSLTFLSVLLNVVFVRVFSHPSNTNTISNVEAHIRAHKRVAMKDIYAMSGLFWFYLVVCLLAGAVWTPFVQLSATIFKHRFSLQDERAAQYASIILFLPVIMYPLVGWFTDRFGRRLSVLLLCSVLNLTCYVLLLIPTSIIRTPIFSVMCFGLGYGPAPLLLVILAPFLTEHVSTALGFQKSLEMAGSTLIQTYAGLLLDLEVRAMQTDRSSFREVHVIWIFAGLNVLSLMSVIFLYRLDEKSNYGNVEHAKLKDVKEGYYALGRRLPGDEQTDLTALASRLARSEAHVWRVRLYITLCIIILLVTWVSFGAVMGYKRP